MYKKIKGITTFHHVLLITIILLGVFLRLIRLWELFHFTYDEEVFAFVGKRMFINGHIPLIGGVTPFHIHVAPYFYWLSGIFLYLSRLNPIGWGIVAAVLSGITMIVLYKVGKRLFGSTVGILAVTLYSFSFYQNIFDRHYWGLVFDGLVALLVVFSLFKIIIGKEKFIYLLSAALTFGIHADLSTLSLFVFSIIVFILFNVRISKKSFVGAIAIFLLSFAPLVVFDLRHNFANSKGILQYMTEMQAGRKGVINYTPLDTLLFLPRTMARLLYVFGDTDLAKQYSYCPQHAITRIIQVPELLTFSLIGILMLLLAKRYFSGVQKKRNSIGIDLLFASFLSTYLGVAIYGIYLKGDLFDHYLATLFPLFFLTMALVLRHVWKKSRVFTALLFLFVLSIININQILEVKHSFGYKDKVGAVKWAIEQTENQDFSLDVISSCFAYNGYRYLFYLYGKEPVKSYVDANFTHLYDNPPAIEHPKLLVVIANPDFEETKDYFEEYNRYKKKTIKSAQFGKIEVLLIDNSNLDFVGKF